jgi:hypothetical protein
MDLIPAYQELASANAIGCGGYAFQACERSYALRLLTFLSHSSPTQAFV